MYGIQNATSKLGSRISDVTAAFIKRQRRINFVISDHDCHHLQHEYTSFPFAPFIKATIDNLSLTSGYKTQT